MPTYLYETIPADASEPPRRFEARQSMKDVALTRDPETGQPVRRLVQAGYLNTQRWTKSPSSPRPAASSPGGGSCRGVSACGPH